MFSRLIWNKITELVIVKKNVKVSDFYYYEKKDYYMNLKQNQNHND
jgi:hypothetical protein